MVLPPSLAGAVHVTVADLSPGVAVPIVGAPGTVAGVKALERAEYGPVPATLVAATLYRYAVPFVSPVMVHLVTVPPIPVMVWTVDPPSTRTTTMRYEVTGLPPSLDGAVH